MQRIEAKWILLRELVRWQHRPYDELWPLIARPQCFERIASSGTSYQLEIEPVWDGKPNGDIRVLGSIDDGHRACCPLGYGVLVRKPKAS
jgi:hypothetical protein